MTTYAMDDVDTIFDNIQRIRREESEALNTPRVKLPSHLKATGQGLIADDFKALRSNWSTLKNFGDPLL